MNKPERKNWFFDSTPQSVSIAHLRKHAKRVYFSKKFLVGYMFFMSVTLLMIGISVSLGVKTLFGKMIGLLIVTVLFGTPFLIIFFIRKSSEKIQKNLELTSEQLKGKFFSAEVVASLEWLDWFDQYWKAQLPWEILQDNGFWTRRWAMEITYQEIPLFLIVNNGPTIFKNIGIAVKGIYLFCGKTMEADKVNLLDFPEFQSILGLGFIPKIKDRHLYFHHIGSEPELLTVESMSELLTQSSKFIEALNHPPISWENHALFQSELKNTLLTSMSHGIGFTLEDLELNRQGRLSIHQKLKLILKSILGLTVSTGLFYWVWHLQFDHVINKSGKAMTSGERAIGTTITIIIGMVIFLFFFLRYMRQFIRGTVESQSGIVETSFRLSTGKSTHVNYFAQLNGLNFRISWKAFEMIIPGLPYQVYFFSKSKEMISIEPL